MQRKMSYQLSCKSGIDFYRPMHRLTGVERMYRKRKESYQLSCQSLIHSRFSRQLLSL